MELEYDVRACEELAKALKASIYNRGLAKSLDVIGFMLASSAQERMEETSKNPEGVAWKLWNKKYAKTRHSGQKILFSEGHLRDDLSHDTQKTTVLVGSRVAYARIHQLGEGKTGRGKSVTMPARQYLGVSKEDTKNMYETLKTNFSTELEKAFK